MDEKQKEEIGKISTRTILKCEKICRIIKKNSLPVEQLTFNDYILRYKSL